MAGSILSLLSLASCANEEPFQDDNSGSSLVRLSVDMNSAVTRADNSLADNCVIYISNDKGVLYKWNGVSNIPASGVYLRYGEYLAQAWTGDSVPASFTEKFLRGETSFNVKSNQASTQVAVNCKLQNVAVSLDVSGISNEVAESVSMNVKSSTGELTYEGETLRERGYFMRNYNTENASYDNTLTYSLKGKDIDGTPFSRNGVIENVLPGYEYKITLVNNPPADNAGGLAFRIEVREYELEIDDTIVIHGKPQFEWQNNEISIERQLYNKDNTFTDKTLFIAVYQDFKNLVLSTDDPVVKEKLGNTSWIDLVEAAASAKQSLEDCGVKIDYVQTFNSKQYRLTFTGDWLNALPPSPQQYVLSIDATDQRGMTSSMKVRIANMEEALDAPFAVDESYWKSNLLSIRAYSAEVAVNTYDDIEGMKLLYRKSGESSWVTGWQSEGTTPAGTNIIKLSGLVQNTSYECMIVGGEESDGQHQYESEISGFNTEEVFTIPNASMENWWLYNNKIWMPNLDAGSEFWDSGNHGATTIGNENDNITTKYTGMSHTGNACAKLLSKFVGILTFGKLGSGNIFTGKYAGTSGTNGKIDFGREYNATHPSKVRVWVNYRPAKAVNRKGANDKYIPEGELDKGQIYIALSDAIKRVDTGDPTTLVTQEKAPDLFLAYGQYTFEDKFGDDNTLQMIDIPFEYYEKAKVVSPKYMIIVCCASKYGDYFSGGDGSEMYVDDFEFIYE